METNQLTAKPNLEFEGLVVSFNDKNGNAVMKIIDNGNVFMRGKQITNDLEFVNLFKEYLATQLSFKNNN